MKERIKGLIKEKLRKLILWALDSLVIYCSGGFDGRLIGTPSQVGYFTLIDYGGNVIIGKNVKIGYGVIILSASTITGSREVQYVREPVIIGDNVEIGSGAVILPGVKIGDNATIAAGAVVTKNIPPNSIVAGVPAKVVKWKIKSDLQDDVKTD